MAQAWVTIAVDDLDDYLVAAQMTALKTAALKAGQSNPFTNVMTSVVTSVRNAIETCGRNQLSATALTVPPELKADACVLIIELMQNRIPGLRITEDMRELINAARGKLKRIAECKLAVTEPTDPLDPGDAQKGGDAAVITRNSTFSRNSLDGL